VSDYNAWPGPNKLDRWFVSANFFQSSLVCESKYNLTRVEHSKGRLLRFEQILDCLEKLAEGNCSSLFALQTCILYKFTNIYGRKVGVFTHFY